MPRLLPLLFLTVGLLGGIPIATAQNMADNSSEKPGLVDVETLIVEAEVTAINLDTRQVTLKMGEKSYTITASPKIRNLAQVRVGDLVVARHTQALAIQVIPGGGLRSREEKFDYSGNQSGGKPAGNAEKTVTIVADILAVDRQAGVVTVKGPNNNVEDISVKDKSRLENVRIGDQVELEYIQAVAISVEPKPR